MNRFILNWTFKYLLRFHFKIIFSRDEGKAVILEKEMKKTGWSNQSPDMNFNVKNVKLKCNLSVDIWSDKKCHIWPCIVFCSVAVVCPRSVLAAVASSLLLTRRSPAVWLWGRPSPLSWPCARLLASLHTNYKSVGDWLAGENNPMEKYF